MGCQRFEIPAQNFVFCLGSNTVVGAGASSDYADERNIKYRTGERDVMGDDRRETISPPGCWSNPILIPAAVMIGFVTERPVATCIYLV